MINQNAINLLTSQICQKHNLLTSQQKAMFMGQCSHESANFTMLRENLNYSAQGLMRTYGKFKNNLALANQYARQPQKIANFVYANRYGNGSIASGDGWAYRGFGYIQLTFKSNWLAFQKDTSIIIINNPSALTQENALQVSLWFWDEHNLSKISNISLVTQKINNIKSVTRIINGGLNGLSDRINLYNEYLAYFNQYM